MRKISGKLRLVATAVLALPVLPIVWQTFGVARAGAPGATTACATGASCVKCVMDSCVNLDAGSTIVEAESFNLARCIDYDGTPPGNCATVVHTNYEVKVNNQAVGSCYKEACNSTLILPNRPCSNPLKL